MSNETNATDDFLDYDINDSLSHFDWAELGPVLVVYSLTFFLGLIGEWKYTFTLCLVSSCFFLFLFFLLIFARSLCCTPSVNNDRVKSEIKSDLDRIVFDQPIKSGENRFFFCEENLKILLRKEKWEIFLVKYIREKRIAIFLYPYFYYNFLVCFRIYNGRRKRW